MFYTTLLTIAARHNRTLSEFLLYYHISCYMATLVEPLLPNVDNSVTELDDTTPGPSSYKHSSNAGSDSRDFIAKDEEAPDGQAHGSFYSCTAPAHGSTSFTCTFNLSKAILGGTIISLPKAFYMLGVLLGSAILLVVGATTAFTLSALARASERTGLKTYPSIVGATCGKPAKVVLILCLMVGCFGFMVVFLVVIGDVLVGRAPDYGGLLCEIPDFSEHCGVHFLLQRQNILGIVTLLLLPLALQRSMDRLAIMNIIGVSAVGAFAVSASTIAIAAFARGKDKAIPWLPNWDELGPTPLVIAHKISSIVPILLTADICQQALIPLLPYLKPYSPSRMNVVIYSALTLSNILYWVSSVGAIVAFGSDLDSDVLNNVSSVSISPMVGTVGAHIIAHIVRVGFGMSMAGSYLLALFPQRDCVVELLFGKSQLQRRLQQHFTLLTLSLVTGVYITAVVIPDIWLAMQIVGCVAATIMGFVLPAVIVLVGPSSPGLANTLHKAFAGVVAGVGMFLFVNGLMSVWYSR